MTLFELETAIREIENNTAIYEEKNFDERVEVTDRLEYPLLDVIEELAFDGHNGDALASLRSRVAVLRQRLEAIDDRLFLRLREEIRTGRRSFREMVQAYIDPRPVEEIGYDNLDIFVNRLLSYQVLPQQTATLDPEMVYFQKTPARVVFELADKAAFTADDTFFDLGAGTGQVVMLVHLLAGVAAVGVEIEPAFCAYARERADEFGLGHLRFISADARYADYSSGTVFFLYTPFVGGILQEVLGLLQGEASKRRIKVISYGPSTEQIAAQDWLEPMDASAGTDPYRVTVFVSRIGAARRSHES